MKCCSFCFNDYELIEFIESKGERSNCNYCKKENAPTIDIERLYVFQFRIEDILNFYESISMIDDNESSSLSQIKTSSLVKLIQDDWNLFDTKYISKQSVIEILYEFFKYNSKYKSVSKSDINKTVWYRKKIVNADTGSDIFWEDFKEDIKHKFRYFFDADDDDNERPSFRSLFNFEKFETCNAYVQDWGGPLYRARINIDGSKNPIDSKDMLIPGEHIVTNGRANPIGINYLYATDEIKTALAEVRSWNGCYVSIATLRFKKGTELCLVDLIDCNENQRKSPFSFSNFFEMNEYLHSRNLLQCFHKDLSKPISKQDRELDYIPTQYICESIKRFNDSYTGERIFDGIIFKSSLGKGNNIVLFSDEKVEVTDVSVYEVTNIKYTSKVVR